MDEPTPGSEPQQPTEPPRPQVDQAALEYFMQQKRAEQNLLLGFVGGSVVAIVSAAVWAAITVATQFQIGWMAVAVGFLVGISVRFLGKGLDNVFGYVGAGLALIGCLLGNLFSACAFVAEANGVSFFEVLAALDPAFAFALLRAGFSPMDLLFYGIAIYEGYRLSFRQISAEELEQVGAVRQPPAPE